MQSDVCKYNKPQRFALNYISRCYAQIKLSMSNPTSNIRAVSEFKPYLNHKASAPIV